MNNSMKIEIENLNKKEIKLMQVLYLIKEKGINIDEIINDISHLNKNNFYSNENNLDSSNNTVYFTDKVFMNDIMTLNNSKIVPKLDFNQVPSYRSESESDENKNNDLIQMENIKFNKINFGNNFYKKHNLSG